MKRIKIKRLLNFIMKECGISQRSQYLKRIIVAFGNQFDILLTVSGKIYVRVDEKSIFYIAEDGEVFRTLSPVFDSDKIVMIIHSEGYVTVYSD